MSIPAVQPVKMQLSVMDVKTTGSVDAAANCGVEDVDGSQRLPS